MTDCGWINGTWRSDVWNAETNAGCTTSDKSLYVQESVLPLSNHCEWSVVSPQSSFQSVRKDPIQFTFFLMFSLVWGTTASVFYYPYKVVSNFYNIQIYGQWLLLLFIVVIGRCSAVNIIKNQNKSNIICMRTSESKQVSV